MTEYKGEDRRRSDPNHDALIRIEAQLIGFIKTMEKHVVDDDKHFERLYSATSGLKTFMNRAIGAGAILIAVPTIIFLIKLFAQSK